MRKPTPQSILSEIKRITDYLVIKGIANDQRYPAKRELGQSVTKIEPEGMLIVSSMFKDIPYSEMYDQQLAARSFNFKLIDGGLVQLSYAFKARVLTASRLAFLPSPRLAEYQNDPELYLEEVMFSEVVDRQVWAVPIRFDYDHRAEVAVDIHHPYAHVTLGQYQNCRIPVTAPITPGMFVEFILRSFYNTASRELCSDMPGHDHRFTKTITLAESKLMHFVAP